MDDEIIAGGNQRRMQRRKAADRGWTKARRTRFLDVLAATCNVTTASRQIGVSTASAYRLRRRDPHFAELWRAAILTGYDRLEEQLLRAAGAEGTVNDIEPGSSEAVPPPVDLKLAMELLRHHRGAVGGPARRPRGATPRATREEAEAALLKKLDAVEKRLAREQGEVP
ncbi:hypothetical protein ACX40Y_04940 [Sphingomonas sp. RS6]